MARFWQWGSYRHGFCQKIPEASPFSVDSKMDLSLAKSLCDNIFKKGKKLCNTSSSQRRGMRICERKTLQHQGQERRSSRCQSRDSPTAHSEDCLCTVHSGPQWTSYPPAALAEAHAGVGGCPERGCDPVESLH